MERFKTFLRTTLLGGVGVILPAALTVAVFAWLFRQITDIIQPLTDFILAHSALAEVIADLLVLAILIGLCFLVGLLVKTRFGRYIHVTAEERLLKAFPGYSLIKETILQFLGNKKSPFSTVALVRIFDNDTRATAFVTDTHANQSYTVFVPTGPNPTSGQVFHLPARCVEVIDIPVEAAMRSIISCGAGSAALLGASKGLGPEGADSQTPGGADTE